MFQGVAACDGEECADLVPSESAPRLLLIDIFWNGCGLVWRVFKARTLLFSI